MEGAAALDAESRALEQGHRLAPGVGPLVVEPAQATPEPLGVRVAVRQVVREEPAAGSEDPPELGQGGGLVLHVLEDAAVEDAIELALGEREPRPGRDDVAHVGPPEEARRRALVLHVVGDHARAVGPEQEARLPPPRAPVEHAPRADPGRHFGCDRDVLREADGARDVRALGAPGELLAAERQHPRRGCFDGVGAHRAHRAPRARRRRPRSVARLRASPSSRFGVSRIIGSAPRRG